MIATNLFVVNCCLFLRAKNRGPKIETIAFSVTGLSLLSPPSLRNVPHSEPSDELLCLWSWTSVGHNCVVIQHRKQAIFAPFIHSLLPLDGYGRALALFALIASLNEGCHVRDLRLFHAETVYLFPQRQE